MTNNPFYNDDRGQPAGNGNDSQEYGLPVADNGAPAGSDGGQSDPAVELIRRKLAGIYQDEPDAKQEIAEAESSQAAGQPVSKHQRYMQSLRDSGRPMSEIQTAWHNYYQQLPDNEKHEVWQEFYAHSAQTRQQPNRIQPQYTYQPAATQQAAASQHISHSAEQQPAAQPSAAQEPVPSPSYNPLYPGSAPQPNSATTPTMPSVGAIPDDQGGIGQKDHDGTQPPHQPVNTLDQPKPTGNVQQSKGGLPDLSAVSGIRQNLRDTVSKRSVKTRHHLQSLAFGLGFGGLVVVIVLFSFFNEVVIAPFIQPSRNVSATPIIVGPDGVSPTKDDEVIIPKINVQIPLDFTTKTTDEKAFEEALDRGVAHYPTTALPGQQGNTSFFGHSSNNIFNPGKYKFAFVLLNELVPGDKFYLTHQGTVYTYQVYDKKVVAANAVEILNPVPDKKATAMLVTCDPPGTTLRRLAVWGEQISPNPNNNGVATPPASQTKTDLPGNGPTLWNRITGFFSGS